MLAENLNMEPEEAEKWVVNMIRLAHLDAKIDSKYYRNFHKSIKVIVTTTKHLLA